MLKVLSLICLALFALIGEYQGVLLSFTSFLIITIVSNTKFNVRLFSLFFLLYYTIPFLNISNYRGIIDMRTLLLYTFLQLFVIIFIIFFEKQANHQETNKTLFISKTFFKLYRIHLLIIYISLFYAYSSVGFIITNQHLRFAIPPIIEYVIKSGLPVPIIWFFSNRLKINSKEFLLKILLPILPSILIGSRGTFIMVLISFLISIVLIKDNKNSFLLRKYYNLTKNIKKIFLVGGTLSLGVLYSGFYLRRDGINLITTSQLLKAYNFSDNPLTLAILPFYLNLRETIGITQKIIQAEISNTFYSYPFFLAELMTILPGKQIPPGRMLGREVFGAEDYGLTPGILGGLYIDYGVYSYLIVIAIVFVIIKIYNLSKRSIKFSLFYSFSIVQFFHLYHRGFLKMEYFVPYIIIFIYLLFAKEMTKNK